MQRWVKAPWFAKQRLDQGPGILVDDTFLLSEDTLKFVSHQPSMRHSKSTQGCA